MAYPKKIKYTIDTNPPKPGSEYLKYGFDRIQELMIQTDNNTKYLPRTILIEDLDQVVFDYVNLDKMKIIIDGKTVPTFYVENDRWAEYAKTWKFTDGDKNISTPYITVRRIDKQAGTRLGNKFRIPQPRKFRYVDVPILDAGEVINLRFKMPEPVNIDLTYEVILFTKYRVDVNQYDEQILKNFASRQDYVFVKGSPMPLQFEGFAESNTIENIDGDRYFVSKYALKILGFIQNEDEFEIVKTTRQPKIGITIDDSAKTSNEYLTINLNIGNGGTVNSYPKNIKTLRKGTNVILNAIAYNGYRFLNWSINNIENTVSSLTFKLKNNLDIIVNFIKQWTVNISVDGTGSGIVTPSGTHIYDDGYSLTVEATPTPPDTFENFIVGTETITDNPYTLTVNSDKTIIANFLRSIVQLIMSRIGNGTIDPDVGTHDYIIGTNATLTATESDADFYFEKFTVDGVDTTDNPLSLTMDSGKSVEAIFLALQTILNEFSSKPIADGSDWVFLDDLGNKIKILNTSGFIFGTNTVIYVTPKSNWDNTSIMDVSWWISFASFAGTQQSFKMGGTTTAIGGMQTLITGDKIYIYNSDGNGKRPVFAPNYAFSTHLNIDQVYKFRIVTNLTAKTCTFYINDVQIEQKTGIDIGDTYINTPTLTTLNFYANTENTLHRFIFDQYVDVFLIKNDANYIFNRLNPAGLFSITGLYTWADSQQPLEPILLTKGCSLYYNPATDIYLGLPYTDAGEEITNFYSQENYKLIGHYPAGSGMLKGIAYEYLFPNNEFLSTIEEFITAGIYSGGTPQQISSNPIVNMSRNVNSFLRLDKPTDFNLQTLTAYNRKKSVYDTFYERFFALPQIEVQVGVDTTIYGETLINIPIVNNLEVTYSGNIGTQSGNNLVISPVVGDIGQHTITVTFINDSFKLTETFIINVSPQCSTSSIKMLLIGDSTLANGFSIIAAGIRSSLNKTITFVGTQGTTDKHEGRPGWTTATFTTTGSPFVKSDVIDIPAYFSDNSIDTPDIVHLRLGVNDIYAQCSGYMYESELAAIVTNIKNLIDAFLAFDANLKFVVAVPTICTNNEDVWAASYDPTIYIQNWYIMQMHELWDALVTQFTDYDSRVSLSAEAITMNRSDDYYNAVHPYDTGYTKLGTNEGNYFNKLEQ